ncbi:GNAT family N-acetyltransferase [Sediminicoccus sp. KRV36]|uniref:GNAT family N-acetyltransferase n=1 Tax=Sediminicoccus sp. KRV36 TaxID=3133721 RepID=UPI00200C1582|nr:GNAT family N-acetyltransferase [Sediminicoccus rosea]UPY35969.1 GNAT family N-acetyltransferase [Sediminicoccus rosea]
MNPPLRLARPGEAPAIRAMVRAAYAHYVPLIGIEPLPMVDDYAARIAAGQAWVLEQDGQMAGLLVLEDTPEGLLLDNIAVAEAARGQGHGRAMIAFAEAEARRRGQPCLWLYTNEKMTENIALYTRLGFVELRREEKSGRHAVIMEKRL